MNYKKKVLKNGLRIITVLDKNSPTSTVYCLVETGSKYESKKLNGISHFLEHMCFKGTKTRTRDEISFELDSIGASNNAFTSMEYTGYYAKAQFRHTDKILDVVSDIYLNSTFPEDELEKEKGVVVEEIKMYEDLPQRKINDVLLELLYGKNQPAGWSIAGTPENVRSLKKGDLVKYYKEHYVPNATTVVVAGRFDEKKIIQGIEKRFLSIKKSKKNGKLQVRDSQKKPEVAVHFKKTDQTHFALAFRTFNMYDKRMPTLSVLDHILGGGMSSRLFKKMRDELGICYYIKTNTYDLTDHGFLEILAGVPQKRLAEAVSAILEELKKMTKKLPSIDEMKKVKDYIAGHLFMGLESSDDQGSYFGFQEALRQKIKTPEGWLQDINKVTPEDVRKLAKEIFRNNLLNLAVIGPIKDKKKLQKILRF